MPHNHALYMREYRRTHPEYRERQRQNFRRFLEEHPNYFHDYNKEWKKKHPDKVRQHAHNHRQKNTEKIKARLHSRYLEKASACANCGSNENLEFHHPDYSNSSLTITLCRECHRNFHNGQS